MGVDVIDRRLFGPLLDSHGMERVRAQQYAAPEFWGPSAAALNLAEESDSTRTLGGKMPW
jgi:hypothetical protein